MLKKTTILVLGLVTFTGLFAQDSQKSRKFEQLGTTLPTPNTYRNAAGAPGHAYWQQKADYSMEITLDDQYQKLSGNEQITYHNNSPDDLDYLWVQLDQNMRAKDSDTYKVRQSSLKSKIEVKGLMNTEPWFDGGFKLDFVNDKDGKPLHYVVNKTMMRVDLPQPLKSGESYTFNIKWWYNINDREKIGGRSGYEYFPEEDNYLYTIAQFFPRMCVYDDVEGWQNKQFLGRGEFALPFGDYDVKITVPSDHIIGATGVLQNTDEILTKTQLQRWEEAQNATEQPVMIVNEKEAKKNEKGRSKALKTWHYKAENVRDFGFASSRKFIWDAMAVKFGDRTVMAMSYYPKEGNPLWEKYSTKVVAHTIRSYSDHTFDYPYPAAISVNSAQIGMEYPMICFNYGRPEKDGTYSERVKYGMIGVIIHEVGHNFFPMIVNSDERQWTWMDEGLNTFCQFLAEQEFQREYPSRRGPARNIVDYMKGDKSKISPIMTNSESIFQFGNNAYGKPATALNILRETIMGRELFDFAFTTYTHRWMFKHPSPADFFRTMEDASGVDLDWFWKGWFYGTDHVDIAISSTRFFQLTDQNPNVMMALDKRLHDRQPEELYYLRNKKDVAEVYAEKDPSLHDFYSKRDAFKPIKTDFEEHEKLTEELTKEEVAFLKSGKWVYEVKFENKGGLPMPIIVEFEYKNGKKMRQYIPAEIWRTGHQVVSKVFILDEEVKNIVLDPSYETADVDVDNNYWPERVLPTRFDVYKKKQKDTWYLQKKGKKNTMQKAK